MKKIRDFLYMIFTPTKIFQLIRLNRFDQLYERLVNSERALKWSACLLVVMIYLNTLAGTSVGYQYAEDVRGKALNVLVDAEKYKVEGLPKTVDFTIEGKEGLVKSLIQNNTFSAFVDLTHLKPGQHIVKVNYDVLPSTVKVSINPENVSILIKELTTVESTPSINYVLSDQLDPTIVLGDPLLELETVQVTGSKDIVSKLASVQGVVDVSTIEKSNILTATLSAVDKEGTTLDLAIEPATLSVTVPYSQPQKELPVQLNVTEGLPEGMVLEEIIVSPETITVFGKEDLLTNLTELLFDVTFSDLGEQTTGTLSLQAPSGVTGLSASQISFELKLVEESTRTFKEVPIIVNNLDPSLQLKKTLTTDITLTGLSTNLNSLTKEEVQLVVNAKGLEAGTHELSLKFLNKLPKQVELLTPTTLKIDLIKR